MEPCVSCIYLTYCMEYVWKSSLWISIFQRATQRARILLTDNIQSGGSCSVNYYWYRKQKLLRVSRRFELSRVRVTEGKTTVNVWRKSRGNRFWIELARIRVIGSRLYLPSKGPKRQTTTVGMASSGFFPAKMVVLYVASVVGLLACKSTW